MNKKQKEFWKQFCQSKNKDEETLKKLLFNGDLINEEFEYIISCVIGPLFAPSLFYPALFKKCPQLMDQCNWTMLNHVEWRDLLMEYPQFADKCDFVMRSPDFPQSLHYTVVRFNTEFTHFFYFSCHFTITVHFFAPLSWVVICLKRAIYFPV